MNLAFQALAVLVLSLPGVILRYTYRKGFWPRPIVLRPVAEEVAYSLVLACCLHALYGGLVHRFVRRIDLQSLGYILAGNFGFQEEHLSSSISSVTANPYLVLAYFVTLYLISGGLGYGAHWCVRRFHLDRQYQLLRFDNDWHYLLRGEILNFPEAEQPPMNIAGALVAAVSVVGDQSYLFVGILQDFHLDRVGNLDRIVLQGTYRRDLSKDPPIVPPDEGSEESMRAAPPIFDPRYYYYIEANYIVLKYSEVKNLAVWYLAVDI